MTTGIFNIHEVIGWFNCANLNCHKPLSTDHVTLTTTAHMRRFCCVPCIVEGETAWYGYLSYVYKRFDEAGFGAAHECLRAELPQYVAALDAARAKVGDLR